MKLTRRERCLEIARAWFRSIILCVDLYHYHYYYFYIANRTGNATCHAIFSHLRTLHTTWYMHASSPRASLFIDIRLRHIACRTCRCLSTCNVKGRAVFGLVGFAVYVFLCDRCQGAHSGHATFHHESRRARRSRKRGNGRLHFAARTRRRQDSQPGGAQHNGPQVRVLVCVCFQQWSHLLAWHGILSTFRVILWARIVQEDVQDGLGSLIQLGVSACKYGMCARVLRSHAAHHRSGDAHSCISYIGL